jgi:hypothetical protein
MLQAREIGFKAKTDAGDIHEALIHFSRSLIVCLLSSCFYMCLGHVSGNKGAIYCGTDSGKTGSGKSGSEKTMCIDDNGKTWHRLASDNQSLPDHPTQAAPARPLSRPIYEKLIPEFGAGDRTGQKAKSSREPGKTPAKALSLREIVAAVRINNHLVNEFALLAEDENGRFYAGLDVISATRLSVRPAQSSRLHERDYYSLDLIPGLTYRFDGHSQSLSISIASSRFAESVLRIPRPVRLQPTVPSPGMFFNHDIEFTHSPGENVATGLLETGFFTQAGVLTSQFVSRNFEDASQFARLQT